MYTRVWHRTPRSVHPASTGRHPNSRGRVVAPPARVALASVVRFMADKPRGFHPPPGGGIWIGTDFQIAPDEHGIALCGACRRLGTCRLGITSKDVDEDG